MTTENKENVRMRVVIVANGIIENPRTEFDRWIDDGDSAQGRCTVVGADGGTSHLLACGIIPQHVIGDLDSLASGTRANLEAQGVTFHTHPADKDETDLELALIWAAAHYPAAELIILGAMGGRPDQALANMLLLALPGLENHDVILAEGIWQVRVVRGGESHTFTGKAGDTLSLIPLGGPVKDVTTSGLKFPLSGETLFLGPARGVSNVFLGKEATVTVGTGLLWVMQRSDGRIRMRALQTAQ